MLQINTKRVTDSAVVVPGSKSYTHRILIASALSTGNCVIRNGLESDDTRYTIGALRQMGVEISRDSEHLLVRGTGGRFLPFPDPIDLGNSGTSMRLLTAVASLGQNTYRLTGSDRMRERPIQDLVDALQQLHIPVKCINSNGCPPVEVKGGRIDGGPVSINCRISSQYLSALLLIAPLTREGLDITVTEGPVSRPYVDMTVSVMERLKIIVHRNGYEEFHIPGNQAYSPGHYLIEPDCSQAGYFWATAAVTGACVTVEGLSENTEQGDLRFTEVLEQMGCRRSVAADGISIAGRALAAVDIDMSDMPDLVPTLAVVAAFAEGTTVIRNVAHLRVKESDRLGAVAGELAKLGINARCTDDGLIIQGGRPSGAVIDPHDDHRLAMSFAVVGLVTPGIRIQNERCVEKSFPDFWVVFEGLNGE